MKKLSLQKTWNDTNPADRLVSPRSYIYASDLGRGLVDRLLTMRGITPTNKFTSRLLRVFDVGNMFEAEMKRMFELWGIFISSQNRIVVETPGLLTVVGRHDPLIGGEIKYEEAKARINEVQRDENGDVMYDPNVWDNDYYPLFKYDKYIRERALALLDKLVELYPNGVEKMITEIKTVNSQAFWADKNKHELTDFFKGYDHHRLQLHTYVKGLNIPGRLLYMSKDDQTLMESQVDMNDKKLEKLWLADVAAMTKLYNEAQMKPLLKKDKNGRITIADWLRPYQEQNIVWNEDKKEFEKNWKATYTNYLTLITGFKDKDEWESSIFLELKKANIIPCKICEKEYTRATLNKYDGMCGRCLKKKEKEAAQIIEDQKIKDNIGTAEQAEPNNERKS